MLQVAGEPLMERQLRLLKEAGANEILLSIGQQYPGRSTLDPNIRVVTDRLPSIGPLGGIDAAFGLMSGTHLLVLAVDLPQMSSPLLQLLIHRSTVFQGVVPRVAHQIEPLVAVYPSAARTVLGEQLDRDQFSVAKFAQHCHSVGLVQLWDVPNDLERSFLNWNRPGDWSILKEPVARP